MRSSFTLNGRPVEVDGAPMERLLDVLRERLGLTGTKEGCGEGECGACTVLLDGEPVLSCLVPLFQCEGRRIETVEGVAAGPAREVLERFVAAGGVQCGACTPGIVVTAWALLQREPGSGPRAGARGPGRQPLPLHGVRGHSARSRAGVAGAGAVTSWVIS